MILDSIILIIYSIALFVIATGGIPRRLQGYEEKSKRLYKRAIKLEDENLEFYKQMYYEAKGGQRVFGISIFIIIAHLFYSARIFVL